MLACSLTAGCANPNAIGLQEYGSINGVVYSAKTNLPIANAYVYTNVAQFARTDTAGQFTLNNVPAGAQQVNVSASGYQDVPAIGVQVQQNQTSSVSFALTPVGS